MARTAGVWMAGLLLGLALAGCSAPAAPSGLETDFRSKLGLRDGERVVRDILLEGDFGAGWNVEPNRTVDAPRIDQTAKEIQLPGGGTATRLPPPPVDLPLKVRMTGLPALAGYTVSWGVFALNGTEPVWTEPAPFSPTAEIRISSMGTSRIVARLTDASGASGVTADPLLANLHVRWTIDSVVWPLAPSANGPSGCEFREAVFFCYGTRSMFACAFVEVVHACAGASTWGAYVSVCAVVICLPIPYVENPVPVDVPDAPRPPNYDEMADYYVFDAPMGDGLLDVATTFRGDPEPSHGNDVDLEITGPKGSVRCRGNPTSSEVPVVGPFVDTQGSEESVTYRPVTPGAWTVRVGSVSCPSHSFYNKGVVPYTATILLKFGEKVPQGQHGVPPDFTDRPKPTPAP